MTKKEQQEQNMRDLFIKSTKEIMRGEGLAALSVRTIAERAGYSYATLYNYFKDIKDLIYICVKDFLSECEEMVTFCSKDYPQGAEKINIKMMSYLRYFIQYPGIFELLYMEKIKNIGSKQLSIDDIDNFIDKILKSDIEYMINENIISENNSKFMLDQLKYTLTGMLLIYLNHRKPDNYQDFISTAQNHIAEIIKVKSMIN